MEQSAGPQERSSSRAPAIIGQHSYSGSLTKTSSDSPAAFLAGSPWNCLVGKGEGGLMTPSPNVGSDSLAQPSLPSRISHSISAEDNIRGLTENINERAPRTSSAPPGCTASQQQMRVQGELFDKAMARTPTEDQVKRLVNVQSEDCTTDAVLSVKIGVVPTELFPKNVGEISEVSVAAGFEAPSDDVLPPDTPALLSGAPSARRALEFTLDFGRISLNPNAAEFVPNTGQDAEKSTSARNEASSKGVVEVSKEGDMRRTSSATSAGSDDEYRQLLRAQLPDELTFDDSPQDTNSLGPTLSAPGSRQFTPGLGTPGDFFHLRAPDSEPRHMPGRRLSFEPGCYSRGPQGAPEVGFNQEDGMMMSHGLNSSGLGGPETGPGRPSSFHLSHAGAGSSGPSGPMGRFSSPQRLSEVVQGSPVLMSPHKPRGHGGPPGGFCPPVEGLPWAGADPRELDRIGPHGAPNIGSPLRHLLPGPSPGRVAGVPGGSAANSPARPGFGPVDSLGFPHGGTTLARSTSPMHSTMAPFTPPRPHPMASRFSAPPASTFSPPPSLLTGQETFYPHHSDMPLPVGVPPFELPPGPRGSGEHPPGIPPPWSPEPFEGRDVAHGPGLSASRMAPPLGNGPLPVPIGFLDEGGPGMVAEDPVRILSMEFPGYPLDSLVEIFVANGSDLLRTIEMLTQLELQDDASRSALRSTRPSQHMSPAQPGYRPLMPSDFPSLRYSESADSAAPGGGFLPDQSGGSGMERPGGPQCFGPEGAGHFRQSSSATDFAAVVRKQVGSSGQGHHMGGQHQRFGQGGMGSGWHHDRGPPEGSGRGRGRGLGFREYSRPPGQWLETGESVGNMYGSMREEARDHARVRNAYFEQATQAYLSGNKALAKELSSKGQWHNEQMKAAHAKASEAIFRHRNLASGFLGSGRGGPHPRDQDGGRTLDLHGLHVGEALPILRRELAAMRNAARISGQQQQVFVCVGTGHHTKGRTPARLPAAVERYLVEEEGVQFTEAQPGLLRVVV